MKNLTFLFFLLITSLSIHGQSQIEILVKEGTQLHDQKEYEKAIEKYKEALKIDSDSWLANYEIAYTFFELKNYNNTIFHAEKSIKDDKNNAYYAYIILGTAYDLIKNPKKAIKTYQKGIRKHPDQYLLYYNIALTTFNQNDLDKAELNASKAIQLNPNHTTSHLLLAYVNNKKGLRSKAVLSLYYFLMLEPQSSRSPDALKLLKGILRKGVNRRDEKNVDVTLNMNKDNEFSASDMMISLLEASKNTEENKDKSNAELFYQNTKSFFTILSELSQKEKEKGFYHSFYVPFFKNMNKAKHVEALCYYIQSSENDKEVLLWLELNGLQISKLGEWFEEYDHSNKTKQ